MERTAPGCERPAPPARRTGAALSRARWTGRAAAQRELLAPYLVPARARALARERHPVWDFLFEYYSVKPTQLERFHAGFDAALADAPEYANYSGYVVDSERTARVDPELCARRARTIEHVRTLLRATADRPPVLACFGMHEWAMLYRDPNARRHPLPLRLGSAGTDAVVERVNLRCTHFDAFRFFTEPARPLNRPGGEGVELTRADQVEREQPGCVHAGMDLLKWSLKLGPLLPSAITTDAFLLAARARELDMAASPYDLTQLGLAAVPVETPGGRAEYVRTQTALMQDAQRLRDRILSVCDQLS